MLESLHRSINEKCYLPMQNIPICARVSRFKYVTPKFHQIIHLWVSGYVFFPESVRHLCKHFDTRVKNISKESLSRMCLLQSSLPDIIDIFCSLFIHILWFVVFDYLFHFFLSKSLNFFYLEQCRYNKYQRVGRSDITRSLMC